MKSPKPLLNGLNANWPESPGQSICLVHDEGVVAGASIQVIIAKVLAGQLVSTKPGAIQRECFSV
jgi:hypothetical protein